ncbi:MAG: F0F1 ATP synthase subunit epsilon [Gammaproteobacteria bacterium]|jgi:F-type H+-transporting ATPase subunit epsilon|uniref:F0F1 ATP synthase subunit epsilon n=1 Tax=Candidatus Njordibacter sp. Uisw_058 TaxID=3230974 RepID=UPI000E9AD620|nr:F0F1 ATP synthase subunit epsilon [Oceanospirillaceae bacterium]MDE1061684.1 F0F1 ATP synthase subunit epsilon [Pseudomonadales bacterium]CAI8335309.1 MAG: ATP synthase epsilon chain [Oceanospirillaceae bacterium UBA2001]MBT5630588.1 F0F1 ATP synthase subunit epsilon [Oceanospirillaceae bacterium]MBT6101719.1 F0F1 ATP synthase subunit epsilon [Oceanospirillaceae bacterium]|tara:strand:- start:3005 stop:3430 length:426 start_codon:yes stop_codon:yes gene_type:complete
MATSVDCDIVSAEESIFEGKVEFISLTGTLGELGIYPGHTPLLSEVKPGPVRLRMESGEEDIFYVSGGFLEVQPHKVILMADTALRAADLNEAAAEEASRQAEQAMADRSSEFEYSRAAGQLAEAAAQLRTLRQIRQKLGK